MAALNINLKLCKKQRAVKHGRQNTISHLPNNHSVSTSQLSLTASHHTMSLINAHYTNKSNFKSHIVKTPKYVFYYIILNLQKTRN